MYKSSLPFYGLSLIFLTSAIHFYVRSNASLATFLFFFCSGMACSGFLIGGIVKGIKAFTIEKKSKEYS